MPRNNSGAGCWVLRGVTPDATTAQRDLIAKGARWLAVVAVASVVGSLPVTPTSGNSRSCLVRWWLVTEGPVDAHLAVVIPRSRWLALWGSLQRRVIGRGASSGDIFSYTATPVPRG